MSANTLQVLRIFSQLQKLCTFKMLQRTLHCKTMNQSLSRLKFPSVTVKNSMILVAEIVDKDNPWAFETSCPTFNSTTISKELDHLSKDILALVDDIRSNSLLHNATECKFTVKSKTKHSAGWGEESLVCSGQTEQIEEQDRINMIYQ